MKQEYMEQSSLLLREFFGYLESIKVKSELTVNEYFLDLRTFFRYYKLSKGLVQKETDFDKIGIEDVDFEMCKSVTLSDVFLFMNYLSSVRKNDNASKSRKCSALRAFFNYLSIPDPTGGKKLENNPVENLNNPKLKKSLPKFLTLEQSFDLLNAVEGKNQERDFCIIMLFLNCGMRLSELVGMNFGDLLSDNRIRLRGKGSKERIIYMNQACVDALTVYINVRPKDGVIDRDAIFLSNRLKRISPKTVQALVKKYLAEIGLGENGYSVHKLRHTAATLMYQQGNVDVRVLKDILGHENLGTTQIYTHVSDARMQAASDSNPIGKLSGKAVHKKKSDI